MKDIKIAIAYHKASPVVEGGIWLPLHVGKSLHPQTELNMQTDDSGDNISDENGYYCELTGIYWLWKNTKADYKGLCHYRRIFSDRPLPSYLPMSAVPALAKPIFIPQIVCRDPQRFAAEARAAACRIDKALDKAPIVAPRMLLSGRTCYSHFVRETGPECLDLLDRTIREKYPEYSEILRREMRAHKYRFANMSVMRNDLFEEYCEFMFGVTESIKRALVEEKYIADLRNEKIFSRKLGYIGEILTHLYIRRKEAQGVAVKSMNVAFLDI